MVTTKHGVPVAELVPSRPQAKRKREGFLGSMRGTAGLAGDIVSPALTEDEWGLVPVAQPVRKRMFGALKGKASTTAAFFKPLAASELDAWER